MKVGALPGRGVEAARPLHRGSGSLELPSDVVEAGGGSRGPVRETPVRPAFGGGPRGRIPSGGKRGSEAKR